MNDENWKEELKEWNPNLKPYQIKLLDEGARSNSQTLILSDMWLEWKELLDKKELNGIADQAVENIQPYNLKPNCIDDQFLQFVQPLN